MWRSPWILVSIFICSTESNPRYSICMIEINILFPSVPLRVLEESRVVVCLVAHLDVLVPKVAFDSSVWNWAKHTNIPWATWAMEYREMLQCWMALKVQIPVFMLQHQSLLVVQVHSVWTMQNFWRTPLTKTIGLAMCTLKKEMWNPVIFNHEKSWLLPIDFIFEHNTNGAPK